MLVALPEQAGLGHDNTEALVTDSESTMNKLGRDLEPYIGQAHPCKCHGVELVVKPWSEGDGARPLMSAVRTYITAFAKSANAMAALKTRQEAAGERPLVMKQGAMVERLHCNTAFGTAATPPRRGCCRKPCGGVLATRAMVHWRHSATSKSFSKVNFM
jgi:hypothetical protein